MAKYRVLNSAGEEIRLTPQEQRVADINQRKANALGYEIDITTLTAIVKKVTEQKFFQLAPADYIPVRVGEGAWSAELTTYRSFELADAFETGIINMGANNGRLAGADAGIDSVTVPVINWAKTIGWTVFELQQASRSGNWDLVTSKEKARKTNWDLGIQQVAFLGCKNNTNARGLLTQSGVNSNSALIPGPISAMSTTSYKALLAGMLGAYRSNNNHTAMPSHFIIPEADYLGLASPVSKDFPINSSLEVLEKALKIMTRNPNFKILPCAYGETALNSTGYNRYVLLNYDETSIRMDIPVDYTNTLANSLDNFAFQNVGYGQFTGVMAYRPLEVLYFDYA